jgi:hypothetical protein
MKKSQAMTKRQFKQALEDILLTYFRDNQNRKDLPHGIDFDYIREEPNKNSYGFVTFRNNKKDVTLEIKALAYYDKELGV